MLWVYNEYSKIDPGLTAEMQSQDLYQRVKDASIPELQQFILNLKKTRISYFGITPSAKKYLIGWVQKEIDSRLECWT